jgi:hypothetical protein
MEIKLNPGRGPDAASGQPIARREAAPAAEAGAFEQSQALERTLKSGSDIRPEKIAQARAVLSDVKYPPNALLDSIANLLAVHMKSE